MTAEIGKLILLNVLNLVKDMKNKNMSYDDAIASLEKMIEVYDERR